MKKEKKEKLQPIRFRCIRCRAPSTAYDPTTLEALTSVCSTCLYRGTKA